MENAPENETTEQEPCKGCGDDVAVVDGEVNYPPYKDEVGGNHGTTICDLPRQVWLEIYENIDYPTYLNLRTVNHHFCNLIDNYIGFRVNFNKNCERDPDMLDFYSNVALNDVQFDKADNPERYNLTLFKYPSFLTDVSFNGRTSLKLIQDILRNCYNLELVEMTMDCKIIREDDMMLARDEEDKVETMILPGIDIFSKDPPPPSRVCLTRVECLKLVPGIHNDDNLRSHVVLSILRATRSKEHLRKVIFQCELSQDITLSQVLIITAELMEKHHSMEALFVALLNDEYLLESEETKPFSHYMDLGGSEKERDENLEYFRRRIVATGRYLQIRKMGLSMLNRSMQLIWGDFLRTQHRLVHLSLTVTITEGTFSEQLFEAFAGTLEQLAVRGKFEVAFDFQHIASCRNLKEICLHNLQEDGGGGVIPKCINLPQVADDLESLILFQVVTRTEELETAVRKLDKLHTLVVFKCGHAAGETGVGLSVLQDVLHKRSLQSILMVQFICGSTTEAETLAAVLYDLAQDVENQANPMRRRRRRIIAEQPQPQANVIEIHPIPVHDGGDNIMFPLGGRNQRPEREDLEIDIEFELEQLPPPIPRPVSRGHHRNPDFNDEDEEDDDFPKEIEENENVVEANVEFSLDVNQFPPLPDPDQEPAPPIIVEEVDVHQVVVEEEEALEIGINFVVNPNNQDPPAENNNEGDENNNNNNALQVLQNILEQALVANGEIQLAPQVFPNHEGEDMELVLDMGNQNIRPIFDLFEAERLAREHNVQVGFILDGVIDIMNEEAVRSKWLCVEDADGHITYTLKISVEL